DLKESLVTLVLSQPPLRGGDKSRTFKVRARIVSSVRRSLPPDFRHGLFFLRSQGDGLEFLEELLKAVAAAVPDAPAGGGRLAQLKQLAQAKLTEEKKPDTQEEKNARVSEALQRAYEYLKELTEQLNIVKPGYAKGYAIVGVPEFSNLAWESGRADLRTRDVSPTKKIYEQVTLNFRVSGNKQIRVSRESPASDRLKQVLTDNKIEFKANDERNRRGSTVFEFACEVRGSVILEGRFETGRILLKARNVERFGMLEHQLVPEAITRESLEEFAGFILGETNRVGPLLLKGN
ncbi:MAG: hypothetical protein ABUU24_08430, partial [Variovorax sp.]